MRIDKLVVENFRCFKYYEVVFGSDTTILIGKNGTGKTNLITALVYSMSFPFAKNTTKGIQSISTSSPDLSIAAIDIKGINDAFFDYERRDYRYPIVLNSFGVFNGNSLEWSLVKDKKSGRLQSLPYQNAFQQFQQYFIENNDKKPLPIIAYFSDSFPHNESNISAYAKSVLKTGFPRNFGYYQWDKKTNCVSIWQERFIDLYTSVNNARLEEFSYIAELGDLYTFLDNEPLHEDAVKWELRAARLKTELEKIKEQHSTDLEFIELNFITSRVKKFMEPLHDEYNFINQELEIKQLSVEGTSKTGLQVEIAFKDGRKMFFSTLPQGYKRILSMVLDIAYRSFILNRDTEPVGVVFIDEIELHLHPTLQQEVLQRFKKTFPKVQFIVSTHSPLVISNFKVDSEKDKIIKLINEGSVYRNELVPNNYGVDYTSSLIEAMDVDVRFSTVDKFINSYLFLKTRNKVAEAEAILIKLKEYLGQEIPLAIQKKLVD